MQTMRQARSVRSSRRHEESKVIDTGREQVRGDIKLSENFLCRTVTNQKRQMFAVAHVGGWQPVETLGGFVCRRRMTLRQQPVLRVRFDERLDLAQVFSFNRVSAELIRLKARRRHQRCSAIT